MNRGIARTILGSLVLALLLGSEPPTPRAPVLAPAPIPTPLNTLLPPPNPLGPTLAPAPRSLRTELDALTREREYGATDAGDPGSLATEKAMLRGQLLELVKQIGERKKTPTAAHQEDHPKFEIKESDRPLDSLRQAQNLYRTNDFQAALITFKKFDPAALNREDRPFVQYMTASCLRRLGKLSDAAALYREVADAKEDEFLAECAKWQLSSIHWMQELEAQLEELRSRRKSK